MSATIDVGRKPGHVIDEAAVSELRAKLGDRLITPDDQSYEDLRRVWNGMIDKRPALIARCHGVVDVVDCVRWASDHDALLAVRGGGHNVAGFGTCDGGLVIDLSPMKGVRVDPGNRTARAQGGATWGTLTARRNSSAWRRRGALSPPPELAALRWAVAKAGCVAPMAWPATA